MCFECFRQWSKLWWKIEIKRITGFLTSILSYVCIFYWTPKGHKNTGLATGLARNTRPPALGDRKNERLGRCFRKTRYFFTLTVWNTSVWIRFDLWSGKMNNWCGGEAVTSNGPLRQPMSVPGWVSPGSLAAHFLNFLFLWWPGFRSAAPGLGSFRIGFRLYAATTWPTGFRLGRLGRGTRICTMRAWGNGCLSGHLVRSTLCAQSSISFSTVNIATCILSLALVATGCDWFIVPLYGRCFISLSTCHVFPFHTGHAF